MKGGRIVDTTAETVEESFLGDAVFTAVLSRIEDASERTLFFAHVALDLPVSAVARAFGFDPKVAEETIKKLLGKLEVDKALKDQLGNIRRAGKPEHYLVLAEKLNLEDWLCARCGRPMVQPKVGRPRKTCSDSCRVALYLANGQGWKDAKERIASPAGKLSQTVAPVEEMRLRSPVMFTVQETATIDSVLKMIVDVNFRGNYMTRDFVARNTALLLLGFACQVQLSPRELAGLAMDDISITTKGLEIRLHWGKGKDVVRQYVTVQPRDDSDMCPVRAMRTWQGALFRGGCWNGPLFPRMSYWDVTRSGRPSMGPRAVASVISNAMKEARLSYAGLSETALLPSFLKELLADGKSIPNALYWYRNYFMKHVR